MLDALRGRLPVPRIVAHGSLRDRVEWRYLILRPVGGRPVREVWPRMSVPERHAVAAAAGRFLNALHRVPPPRSLRGRRGVLLHADLNEDHVIVRRRHGRWRFAGVIDFADARTGDPLGEWMPVWLGLLRHDPGLLRSFLRGYAPRLQITRRWRARAAAAVMAHMYGLRTVRDLLRRDGLRLRGLGRASLRDWLWPPALEAISIGGGRRRGR